MAIEYRNRRRREDESPLSNDGAKEHPGEILRNQFMEEFNLSAYQLAADIRVSAQRIHDILNGHRSISAETALRLSKYFNMSAEFWLHAQIDFDLSRARVRWSHIIERDVNPRTDCEDGTFPLCTSITQSTGNPPDSVVDCPVDIQKVAETIVDEDQRKIFEFLAENPNVCFDILHERTQIAVGSLSGSLTMLEVNGLVKINEQQLYSISNGDTNNDRGSKRRRR